MHSIWKEANKIRPSHVDVAYAWTKDGRRYLTDYVDTAGKELTIAYLNDLGFNNDAAEYIESIIRKSGMQTLD